MGLLAQGSGVGFGDLVLGPSGVKCPLCRFEEIVISNHIPASPYITILPYAKHAVL